MAAVCSLALLGKPFHIDDANFLLYARAVRLDPLRPFAIGAVHSNPPGHQYLLALISLWLGESEAGLHLGLLPLTLLAVWGTQRLAERFGARPAWLPALLAACSPVFLLSATSLMPDVAMLGVLLPALVLLFDDERRPHPLRLLGATLLFATAWTLRFNGLPLLVLAALLSLWRGHRRALVPLGALVLAFACWSWVSYLQLGAAQTLSPLAVAGSVGTGGLLLLRRLLSAASALALVSAVGAAALLIVPARGPRRPLELLGAGCFAASTVWPGLVLPLLGCGLLALGWVRLPAGSPGPDPGEPHAGPPAPSPRKILGVDPDVAFLLLWAASGLAVPIVYNQSAAKYFNLPQIPILFLLVRAAAADARAGPTLLRRGLAAAAVCLGIAAPLLVSDLHHATALRDLVLEMGAHARASGAPRVFVAGTPWGLRVYGPQAGACYLGGSFAPGTADARAMRSGDQILDLSWPGALEIPAVDVALLEDRVATDPLPLRLMSGGAGYWSSDWGVTPFVFSQAPLQRAWRIRVLRPIADPR